MPIQISFDVTSALAKLNAGSAAVRRQGPMILQGAMEHVGRIYLGDMGKRFDRLSAGGPGWAPLAASTLAQKRTKRKLYETGGLRRSLNPGSPHNVLRATPRTVRAATSHPLAKIHHYGTADIPARPIMVQPSPEARRRMNQAIQNAANDLLALAGQVTHGRRLMAAAGRN